MDSVRLGVVLLVAMLAAGCETLPEQEAQPEPQTVTAGSALEIVQAFPVTPRASGTYFQKGAIIQGAAVQHGEPYCRFELDRSVGDLDTLTPQVFTVADVGYEERTTRSGRRSIAYTVLNLSGGLQTDTARLRCRWPWVVGDARYTTPAEIQAAVDGYMRLSLAP